MNDDLDPSTPEELRPLEAELRSMRPAAFPAEMRERVGRTLEAHAGKPRGGLWLAAGALAAAACVVVGAAVALRGIGNPSPPKPQVVVVAPPQSQPLSDESRPALANYRRALSRSTGELDELLDRHAARSLAAGVSTPAGPVTASSHFGLLP